ncbi:hypothetical protein L6452_17541 [Arctium lappa]|uniref:Uncharacterized protein n=1 Tax=Arctium lappa TaxID=4217 RepID=A0ACB9C3J5_ARCLA|nr:hypothetical protein L6452_17541 [Arctium lappa]
MSTTIATQFRRPEIFPPPRRRFSSTSSLPLLSHPQSKNGVDSFGGLGATLIDSLDTLYIMGLDGQFHRDGEWDANSLDINKNYDASVFETTIRNIKALYCYHTRHHFMNGYFPQRFLSSFYLIVSNANETHVVEVLHQLGLQNCFDDVICFRFLNRPNRTTNADNILKNCVVEFGDVLPKSLVICKPFENAFHHDFKMENMFFDDSIRNTQTAKVTILNIVLVRSSEHKKGEDYALESIHNIGKALSELHELVIK